MESKKSTVTIIIGVIVVIVIVAIVALVFGGNHGPAGGGTSATAPSSGAPALYASSADGFSIGFPGTPQVTQTSFASPTAGSIAMTEYKEGSSHGSIGAYYAVYVVHYPAGYQFSNAYLNGALKEYVKIVNSEHSGAALANQTSTQVAGHAAVSALVTVPIVGFTTDNYVAVTANGSNAYIVSTYGMGQSDFNSFVSSLTFAQ